MAANKRITDLTDYISVLPYASEMFGVYQPLIGWKSKRVLKRMNSALNPNAEGRFKEILKKFEGDANVKEIPDPLTTGLDFAITGVFNNGMHSELDSKIAQAEQILLEIKENDPGLFVKIQMMEELLSEIKRMNPEIDPKIEMVLNILSEIMGNKDGHESEAIKKLKNSFEVDVLQVGKKKEKKNPMTQYGSRLLVVLHNQLHAATIPDHNPEFWKIFLGRDHLKNILQTDVKDYYTSIYAQELGVNLAEMGKDFIEDNKVIDADPNDATKKQLGELAKHNIVDAANQLIIQLEEALKVESAIAATLFEFTERQHFERLERLFFPKVSKEEDSIENLLDFENINNYEDPFVKFDPKNDIKDVSLSPLGVVHLYRQYFFELDSFLSTPVSHVWLSPGSSVELIETSTKKTTVEKTFETSIESINKSERQNTVQDDISESVRQNNKNDMKLGFSTTVNQFYPTGNMSATASLNMDKTQEVAREQTNKRMRQQTEKASSEMKQNFKTTFKTITEITDTSSKRYVLNNSTNKLINYEMRRKMRQVGVQVQDIGTYLCWEAFVDEPGEQLGLANLIHIAKPADLITVTKPTLEKVNIGPIEVEFEVAMDWTSKDNIPKFNEFALKFLPLSQTTIRIPDGFEIDGTKPIFNLEKTVDESFGSDDAKNEARKMAIGAKFIPEQSLVKVGVILPKTLPEKIDFISLANVGEGYKWDDPYKTKVRGKIICKPTEAKIKELEAAKKAEVDAVVNSAQNAADAENEKREKEAYYNSVKDRIKVASNIRKRKFEDLREEERIIIYRNLIKALMTEQNYSSADNASRHVLSELINSIFDVDKMLYFVAPEWWKARKHAKLSIGGDNLAITPPTNIRSMMIQGALGKLGGSSKTAQRMQDSIQPMNPPTKTAKTFSINDSIVNWNDQKDRPDNYFITEESEPAPMGSSLGWLLQLDGDDLRNAFLNAPWVKAVIPIRPGKELAAINWLKSANIEGSTGLEKPYSAPPDELRKIKEVLLDEHADDPVKNKDIKDISLEDAIRKLCIDVKKKEIASNKENLYPKEELDDRNKVLSTPINKVYEHGFYPLKGGFKAKTEEPFEVISQWIEVVPTDQIVPVEVSYNPQTGRMNPAKE